MGFGRKPKLNARGLLALQFDFRPALDNLQREQCSNTSIGMEEDKMLTMDLSPRGEHEVGGQTRCFESNQETFARHKNAVVVTHARHRRLPSDWSRCPHYRVLLVVFAGARNRVFPDFVIGKAPLVASGDCLMGQKCVDTIPIAAISGYVRDACTQPPRA